MLAVRLRFALALILGLSTFLVGMPGVGETRVSELNAAQACAQVSTDGMVGWWPGDGNANAIVGGSNGAVEAGTTFAAGRVGQAFSFDGTDDLVRVPNAAALNPTRALTIEAWVNTATSYGPIVSKATLGSTGNLSSGYSLEVSGEGSIRFFLTIATTQGPSGAQFSSPGRNPVLNTWTHLAGTYDGAVIRLYVDGVEASPPTPAPGTIVPSSTDMSFGRDFLRADRIYRGLVDEIGVYSRALSAAEIQSIVNAGTAGKCRPAGAAPPAAPVQPAAGQTNLALRRPATQSSDGAGGTADRAVDGNRDGDFWKGSVSHTNAEARPWWQVDLGAVYSISSVQLFARTDCCGERLANLDVRLSDDGTNFRDFPFPGVIYPSATVPVSGTARYVRVQLRGTEYLHIAELEVYEGLGAAPPSPPAQPGPPVAPAPPPATAPGQALGGLDVSGYCQAIEFAFDLFGLEIEIAPFDGALDFDGVWYCAALDVFFSGIDIYSDAVDLNAACEWQYGVAGLVAQFGVNPPGLGCYTSLAIVEGPEGAPVVFVPTDPPPPPPDVSTPPPPPPAPPAPPSPPATAPQTSLSPGAGVQGLVRNAINGQPIAGATVSGGGRSTTSDAGGAYQLLGLTAGTIRVSAAASGFISDEANVAVPSSGTITQTFALSPALAAGKTRIVLTWRETPTDLDAHLWVGTTHVYFGEEGNETSPPFAVLDADDVSGFGPETITVDSRAACTCAYSVNNFSGESPLATSGARVQVYRGNALVQTFTPPGGTGRWWNVFTFDTAGTITPVNALSNTELGPQAITFTPSQPPPAGGATVAGQVRHASIQGQTISGATVSGGGRTATSGSDGRFQLTGLTPGQVDVRVTASGFVEATQSVTVPASGVPNLVIALSPVLAGNQTQIVLNWGATPSDLDSHLWLPSGAHISYQTRSGAGVNLDVDDTSGSGPETITITQLTPGTYTYAVHNFSGGGSFVASPAIVRVNRGGAALQTFTAPAGTGIWWHVFTMDGTSGAITPVNQLSNNPPR